MKQLILILYFSFTFQLFAQDIELKIFGVVENDSLPIENAHIINLNSHKGTVSNHKGQFLMITKLNDTLQISAIGFNTQQIVITNGQFFNENLSVKLQLKINLLDEVIIDQHKFTKGINASVLQLPNAGKRPLDQNERNLNYYSQESVPIVILATLLGQSGGIDDIYNIVSGNRKKHRQLKKLLDQDKLKELNQKEIKNIRTHFKDSFFINNLDLPKEKINIFIEYCLSKNIIKLFNNMRYVEIIDVFIKEIDSFNLKTK